MNQRSRIALGTVQFGMPYGIANTSGLMPKTELKLILDYARSEGLDTLDTAVVYGESEERLGVVGVKDWKVVTKLPALAYESTNVEQHIHNSVTASLKRLNIDCLYGLLVHDAQQLLGAQGDALYRAMYQCKVMGKVSRIGVSVYSPEEIEALCARYDFDLIQAPFNVIDRRLLTSGWLERLKASNIEIHVRSVFLQGLLLIPTLQRPSRFAKWQQLWDSWELWLAQASLQPIEACLQFVTSYLDIDRIVIGVDNLVQLQDIVGYMNQQQISVVFPDTLMSGDLALINPTYWNQ